MQSKEHSQSDKESKKGGGEIFWVPPITGGGAAAGDYLRWKLPDLDLWSWLGVWGDRIALWVLAVGLLLFYVAYGRKRKRFSLSGVRWLAVLVGYVLDFALTMVVLSMYPDPFSPQHYFLSSLSTVIGAFVAVLIAGRQPMKHGTLVVMADLTLLVVISSFAPIDFGLKEVMRIIVAFLAGGLGASLAAPVVRYRRTYLIYK